MTDEAKALVERLRRNRPIPTLPHEAADAIERLEAENAKLREKLEQTINQLCGDCHTTITRAALKG